MGNGKREFDLVAFWVANDFSVGGELGQGRADGGGADATEFLQPLNGDGFLELGQGLTHSLYRGGRSFGLNRRACHHAQGQGRARFGELERDVVPARRGAMFGGEGQLGAFAAQIQIGVAPAVEFTGTAQGLARAAGVGVFTGMMNQHDGQLKLALKFAQIGEQRGDLGGIVFISCDHLSYVTVVVCAVI